VQRSRGCRLEGLQGKWAAAKANLGVLDDQGQIPADLLATALETDNPAQVIFQLGSNLDRAAELMAMTPAKRAIAMDRMAQVKPRGTPALASAGSHRPDHRTRRRQ
jgi:hypothetical protein